MESIVKPLYSNRRVPAHIYHYTKKENLLGIIQPHILKLKLTRIDKFEDKLEGKACEALYDIALDRLMNDKVIDEDQRYMFADINPNQRLFKCGSEYDSVKDDSYETYVGCYSTEKNDKYMKRVYADNRGACIDFNAQYMRKLLTRNLDGCIVRFAAVGYGLDAVNDLYVEIKRLIEFKNNSDDCLYEGFVKPIIAGFLEDLRCTTKLGKYRGENEVRVIVHIIKNNQDDIDKIPDVLERKNDDLFIRMDRCCFGGISLFGLEDEEERCLIDQLAKHGYRVPDCKAVSVRK